MDETPRVALSWEEYATLTHDDVRGEYIDGELWVDYPTPYPERATVTRLAMALRALLAGCGVVKTGVGWRGKDGQYGPDLMAYSRPADGRPLLAVDVGSSEGSRDARLAEYAGAELLRYWIVDPDGPALTAYELVGGEYQLIGEFGSHDEAYFDVGPARLRIRPGDLLR